MDAADLNLKTAAQALEARYGPHAPSGPTTQAIETMLAHRSVRAYLPDAVPDEVLAMAVASALYIALFMIILGKYPPVRSVVLGVAVRYVNARFSNIMLPAIFCLIFLTAPVRLLQPVL